MEHAVAHWGSDWQDWGAPVLIALRIVLITMLAWLAIAVLQKAARAARVRITSHIGGADAARRAETLGRVIRYLIALVVGAMASMLILAEIGISLAPILGAAGVVGLAVGFGAQSLVKDYFTGFFILLEDQVRAGDVVELAGTAGLVEDLTLRHVRLRDYDGNVHFVPNGLITKVTNMTRDYACAVMDIGVAYRENVEEVLSVLQAVGEQMRADEVFGGKILEALEIVGVERLDPSAVVLRCRFKVVPLEQWNVRREFFRRAKAAFEQKGIEIPFPQMTVSLAPPPPLPAAWSAAGA